MEPTELTSCDLEPIHISGAIQPHGSLVAFKKGAVRLGWWSQDLPAHPLMAGLAVATVRPDKLFGGAPHDAASIVRDDAGGSWRLTPHTHAGNTIVEIQRWAEEPVGAIRALQSGIHDLVGALQDATSVQQLCDAAATILRRITNYDRVMIYRFHEDAHGEVISEARTPSQQPFLGFHYPASDIPVQARAIFLLNWLRLIPDVSATPTALIAASAEAGPLDMSRAPLRSVSPIHLEYLRNMQVKASLTVSIIHKGKLWGLIACHHCTAAMAPGPEVQSACALAGKLISSLLGIKRDEETAALREVAKGVLERLVQRMTVEPDLTAALVGGTPSVLDLVPALGAAAAVYHDHEWKLIGRTPTLEQVRGLASWLDAEGKHDVFHTDRLPALYPPSEQFAALASGLLSVSIPKGANNFVLWFRPEIVHTVSWGGKPDKPANAEGATLNPRHSFAEWKQSVRGTSAPWEDWELDVAQQLRIAILAADLRAQFRKEQQARQEAEAANQVKQDLMAIVSHDLKNPLSGIALGVALTRRSLAVNQLDRAEFALANVERASKRMRRLIDDLLDVSRVESGNIVLANEDVDCGGLLLEAADIIAPLAADKSIAVRVIGPEPARAVRCDRERILQVLSNLAGNALKFTERGGTVTLRATRAAKEVVFHVADTGAGISRENLARVFDRFWQAKETRLLGTGLGLAISKGIVSAHGGRIWVESEPGQGANFMFTLALAAER